MWDLRTKLLVRPQNTPQWVCAANGPPVVAWFHVSFFSSTCAALVKCCYQFKSLTHLRQSLCFSFLTRCRWLRLDNRHNQLSAAKPPKLTTTTTSNYNFSSDSPCVPLACCWLYVSFASDLQTTSLSRSLLLVFAFKGQFHFRQVPYRGDVRSLQMKEFIDWFWSSMRTCHHDELTQQSPSDSTWGSSFLNVFRRTLRQKGLSCGTRDEEKACKAWS